MGKLQALQILFSNNKDVFQPGESIRGEVRIAVSEQKGDIRGIHVKCGGEAHTHWTEQHGSGDNRRTVHYRWDVPLFNQEILLRGQGKNNGSSNRIVLPAGDHRFPFNFLIPSERLPPPLEGSWGWVRYSIKVTIDRPWRFDHHATRYFTIMSEKDLRPMPGILSPQDDSREKTVCCLCCASGPITLRARVDKRGYVPGERVIFSAELNNNSSRKIHDLRILLKQNITYRAHHLGSTHTRHSSKEKSMVVFEGCEPMGSVGYDNRALLVTPVAANNFERCPNIDVNYTISVEADVSGTPLDMEVPLPITIGTIPAISQYHAPPGLPPPHVQTSSGAPPQAPSHHQQSGITWMAPHSNKVYPGDIPASVTVPQDSLPTGCTDQANEYQPAFNHLSSTDDLPPPPSYEMALEGPKEIPGAEGNFGTIMFAPRYPFYNYQGALSELQSSEQVITSQPQSSV